MRTLKQIVLTALLLAGVGEAYPASRENSQDTATLPEYCRYTQGAAAQSDNDGRGKSYWFQRLGPALNHMHHYCGALRHIERARRSPPKERARWYSAAIDNIDYVIRNVAEDYVLMPEFLTRKGEALLHVKRFPEAEQALKKAIELKPDYWPAYAQLAEGFVRRKNVDAAREVLTQGVSRTQEPRVLQRMLDDLGTQRQ